MFIWYKKGNVPGKPFFPRIIRNFIIGIIIAAVVGGIIFFFTNSKEIISINEFESLAAENGFQFNRNGDIEGTVTVDNITASIISCSSATEASDLFSQYCSEFPKEEADNSQNIDFGDSYRKYFSSGDNGILITVQINENVAVVISDNISDEDYAKQLFDEIVK